ncbi:unnamed protein product [Cunninghamella echinulata]
MNESTEASNITNSTYNNCAVINGDGGTAIINNNSSNSNNDPTLKKQPEKQNIFEDTEKDEHDLADDTTPILPIKRKTTASTDDDDDVDKDSMVCLRYLYNYAYDLYAGKNVSPSNYELKKRTSDTTILSYIYNLCLDKLKNFNNLDKLEKSYLSVLLSGIINTVDINNWPMIEGYTNLYDIISCNQLDNFDLHNDTLKSLMIEIKNIYAKSGINGIKIFIHKSNLQAYESKTDVKSSLTLITLDILDHIINMIKYSSWDNESESGYIEYWKPIFKTLFRDTIINIKSGETACVASKIDRQMNEFEYGSTSKSIIGRKIDLIFFTDIDGEKYELLSAEFKPSNVSDMVKRIQQNKNLRLNKSIMTKLMYDTGDDGICVIGMDVVGLNGFMYSLSKYQDMVVAVKCTKNDMFLPRDEIEFEDFLATDILIPMLFNFKAHLLKLYRQTAIKIRRKQREQANAINSRATTPPSMSSVSLPPTFFTPKR